MFRNVLAAALRNLVRNRLYAAISIMSLAAVTVSGHALRVARAKPVGALRYE